MVTIHNHKITKDVLTIHIKVASNVVNGRAAALLTPHRLGLPLASEGFDIQKHVKLVGQNGYPANKVPLDPGV